MANMYSTPIDIMKSNINTSHTKGILPFGKLVLLGLMGGIFLGLGAASGITAACGAANESSARLFNSAVFPIGLMLINVCGAEAFVSNGTMSMAVLDRDITFGQMLRNLITVFVTNIIGAMIVAALYFLSGNMSLNNGLLGGYFIKIAIDKLSFSPLQAIASGILCGILVSMATMMSCSVKEIGSRLITVWFPVFAFMVAGFSHCIANLFYIFSGLLAAMNPAFAIRAGESYGVTAEQLMVLNSAELIKNVIFTSFGNIIGGSLFVGVIYYFIYIKAWHEK